MTGLEEAGVRFPEAAVVALDGEVVHVRYVGDVEVDPAITPDAFALPAGVSPTYDAALAAWGLAHAWHVQTELARGMPVDAPSAAVMSQQLGIGLYQVTGFDGVYCLVVEQQNALVLVDAPRSEERAEAILTWTAAMFPGKAITDVVLTDHHPERIGGLRRFVAEGATIVAHARAYELLADVVAAPSTNVPDELATSGGALHVQRIDAGTSETLDDAAVPVTLVAAENRHAEDFLLVMIPSAGAAYTGGVYAPGGGGFSLDPDGAIDLVDAIDDAGGATTVIGGVGGTAPYSELTDYVAALP